MGLTRHPSARTSASVRKKIRESPESLRTLARQFGVNPKTIAKWKKRETQDDLRPGPKGRQGRLTAEEEGIIVRFREHTLLPLDDCLYALQAQIPDLSRSALHRCLQRHGISRLAEAGEARAAEQREPLPAGWLHIDMAEVQSAEGAYYLFNAIDQASRFVFVRMGTSGDADAAAGFLTALADRAPFHISRVFTLNATPFAATDGESAFTQACRAHGVEHRLTGSPHPWARSQGARMRRVADQDLTFAGADHIAGILRQFVHAYNFRRKLKTLGGCTPYDYLCRMAVRQPALFRHPPHHEMVGLEIMPS